MIATLILIRHLLIIVVLKSSSWDIPLPDAASPLLKPCLVNDVSSQCPVPEQNVLYGDTPTMPHLIRTSPVVNQSVEPDSFPIPVSTPCSNVVNSVSPAIATTAEFSRDLFSPVYEDTEVDESQLRRGQEVNFSFV